MPPSPDLGGEPDGDTCGTPETQMDEEEPDLAPLGDDLAARTAAVAQRSGRSTRLILRVMRSSGGPSVLVARAAFLYGREYGRWEAGAIDTIERPDRRALADATAAQPDLGEQLKEAREVAEEAVGKAAETLLGAIGELHASDLLSQWEGFSRFCRESLDVEPVTVLRAFGQGQQDPSVEVRSVYPAAQMDEANAAEWARRWSWSWRRRVG